jgi:hypothetical protein
VPSNGAPDGARRRRLLLLLVSVLSLLALGGISLGWRRGAFGNSSSHKPSPKPKPGATHTSLDRSAPAPPTIISHPADPTRKTVAHFRFEDGSADATSFVCQLNSRAFKACAGQMSYHKLSQGRHTFTIKARDAAANTSAGSSFNWVVDRTSPPDPVITLRPRFFSSSRTATVAFTDAEAGVSFECNLDGRGWRPCTSPRFCHNLYQPSAQRFAVRARDTAGNRSGTTFVYWWIVPRHTASKPAHSKPARAKASGSGKVVSPLTLIDFTITGSVAGLLPGETKAIQLQLTNPNGVAIQVTRLTVSVSAGSTPPGCPSAGNLQITQSNASSASPIGVPARSSVTLTSAPRAPQITLLNTPDTNQDACKNVGFALSFSGSAVS